MQSRLQKKIAYDKNFVREMLLMISVFFVFLSTVQIHLLNNSQDYITVPGYITDVTSERHLRRSNINKEYRYVLHWFYEGKEYTKVMNSIDKPDENLSVVRINKDNTDVFEGDGEGTLESTIGLIATSVVTYLGWLFLHLKNKDRKKHTSNNWKDIRTMSWLAIVLFTIALMFCRLVEAHTSGDGNITVIQDLTIFCAIGLEVSVIVHRFARIKKQTDHFQ